MLGDSSGEVLSLSEAVGATQTGNKIRMGEDSPALL